MTASKAGSELVGGYNEPLHHTPNLHSIKKRTIYNTSKLYNLESEKATKESVYAKFQLPKVSHANAYISR